MMKTKTIVFSKIFVHYQGISLMWVRQSSLLISTQILFNLAKTPSRIATKSFRECFWSWFQKMKNIIEGFCKYMRDEMIWEP